MNFVDVFYLSEDGLRLYLRDYINPNADAPVVLCLPGLTRNSKDFANLAESLSVTYRVLCPDLRGRGRSQRDSDPTRYRPEQYVMDMLEMLNQLGITKVIVIGTSLGGMMAMRMMAVAPTCVTAVILNDVGPVVEPQGLKRIAGYVGKTAAFRSWAEAAEQIAKINGVAFPNYDREDWINMAHNVCIEQDDMIVLDYDPAIALGVAAGTAATNLWPLFDTIPPKPMLVIRGELSDILSAETQQEMTRRLPMVSAVSIAERGHAPTLDEPDSRSYIQQFLAGLST
jgi:pimeloyl-ACP methyl ester carboxylesterase